MRKDHIKRRRFLGQAAAGALLLTSSDLMSETEPDRKVTQDDMQTVKTDVLVVGGGTAGTIAALQAARAGAKTVLVERSSQLGGTMTVGGVNYPGLFHAWGKQIIAGIGWELILKTVELDSSALPNFTKTPKNHWEHQVRINAQLYAALAEEACLDAGVSVAYYQFPLSIKAVPDGYRLEIVGKSVRYFVECRQLIDCTGGADIVGKLGLTRLRESATQPGTLIFRLGGYRPFLLNSKQIQTRYEKALAEGKLQKGDYAYIEKRLIGFLQEGGRNAQHLFGADSSTAGTQTQANIDGRRSVLRLIRFVRSLPGCENARIESMMQETAVRETYRIKGRTVISEQDYASGRVFQDAVCYSFYPVDLHDETGVIIKPLSRNVVPTVPLGALIPEGSRNLLAAGRCVSSDRQANAALRVQASCMAMGQAAGAAAALAAATRMTPHDVPIGKIRQLLLEHKAIVPAV